MNCLSTLILENTKHRFGQGNTHTTQTGTTSCLPNALAGRRSTKVTYKSIVVNNLALAYTGYLCSAGRANSSCCRPLILQYSILRILYFDFFAAFKTISLHRQDSFLLFFSPSRITSRQLKCQYLRNGLGHPWGD